MFFLSALGPWQILVTRKEKTQKGKTRNKVKRIRFADREAEIHLSGALAKKGGESKLRKLNLGVPKIGDSPQMAVGW